MIDYAQLLSNVQGLQNTVSVQQQQNASLISMADLIGLSISNRTEVVSFSGLSHKELEAVAAEYDDMLTGLRNVFYNISSIAMDNDSVLGHVKQVAADVESLGKEVKKHD